MFFLNFPKSAPKKVQAKYEAYTKPFNKNSVSVWEKRLSEIRNHSEIGADFIEPTGILLTRPGA